MSASDKKGSSIRDVFVANMSSEHAAVVVEYLREDGRAHRYDNAQVLKAVNQIASHLITKGVVEGDRVILSIDRKDWFFICFWACQCICATVVPTAPFEHGRALESEKLRIAALMQAAKAKLCLTDGTLNGDDLNSIVMRDELFCGFPSVNVISDLKLDADQAANPAIIQFTSGSTSEPKGCVLSNSAVLANGWGIIDRCEGKPGDVSVNWTPLHHDMGLMSSVVVPVMLSGLTVMIDNRRFLLNPLCWLEALANRGRVHSSISNFALSHVLRRLKRAKLRPNDLAEVVTLMCGAEPIDAGLVREFLDMCAAFGLPQKSFHAAYGMAEVTVMATSRPHGLQTTHFRKSDEVPGARREIVSVGHPVCGGEIMIVGEDELEQSEGVEGQILIRTPSMMDGYFENTADTMRKISNGWLRTGDIGFVENGDLYVSGRASEVMIVAGRNVYPQDIEPIIARAINVPDKRVCVFSRDSGVGSEEIFALIEARSTSVADILTAKRACLEYCGTAPVQWFTVPKKFIPFTSSGKPQRRRLRTKFFGQSASLIDSQRIER